LSNKNTTLNILFAAVNQTLQAFARDPSGDLKDSWGSSAFCIPGRRRSSTISIFTA
jgi:hypothetical protein